MQRQNLMYEVVLPLEADAGAAPKADVQIGAPIRG